jgi:glutathione S-transferase
MIKLYTFPAAFGLRNVSPFCLKVEMALKHLDLDFEIEELFDPRKAPKGKLPYIEVDGKIIADSELIFEYLDEISQGGLYADLAPLERAQGTAFVRLADDHLYWMMVASRWLDEGWFPNIVSGFFGFVPGLFRGFAAGGAQKQMRKTYDLQGLGRHSMAEQERFARRDFQAISDAVANGRYIAGERLTAFDFAMTGLLSGLMDNKPATWLSKISTEFPELTIYADRVQAQVGVYARET